MAEKHGNLSINSENIFPIIKKWLYSDHDIFARELVSNGCDAITKLKKLEVMGEYAFPDDYKPAVQVVVDSEAKTLKFIDNGIGMTADEVEEYITQIAFSGATEFLEKYKDKTTDDQMIGHFGLGFYSAFMVADEVHIDTLSFKEGATAVHWTCDGGTEYDMQDGDRTTVGTEITLFLNDESLEFCNEYRMREVIEKYCSFMPVNIYLSNANAEQEYETIDEADLRDDDVVVEHIHEDAKTEEKENDHATEILQNTSQNEAENYHFLPEHHLYDGGPKAKFRNNVEAIRLLKSLQEEKRMATREEQQNLWAGAVLQMHSHQRRKAGKRSMRKSKACYPKKKCSRHPHPP